MGNNLHGTPVSKTRTTFMIAIMQAKLFGCNSTPQLENAHLRSDLVIQNLCLS